MVFLEPVHNFYKKFERPISSMSLLLGFVFDILTLKRVDTIWENIWIFGHIIIVALFIFLIQLKEMDHNNKDLGRAHFYYVNILQFFFGGLLSTYLVFYFRSSDIFTTWPFLLFLLGAFVANEVFKKHYIKFNFQISLFFLSVYAFMIFLIPIIIHKMGDIIFLISGFFSFFITFIFIFFLFIFTKNRNNLKIKITIFLISGIFVVVNIFYFTNLIPPIPLSLKKAGVYHFIEKSENGNYFAISQNNNNFVEYFKLYPDFKIFNGEPVYVFSSIFSPKDLNLAIIHEWKYYNELNKKWENEREINLSVIGGRDNGFRTYSKRSNLKFGKWIVNIKTIEGKTIGSVRFNLLPVEGTKETKNIVL